MNDLLAPYIGVKFDASCGAKPVHVLIEMDNGAYFNIDVDRIKAFDVVATERLGDITNLDTDDYLSDKREVTVEVTLKLVGHHGTAGYHEIIRKRLNE